MVDLNVNNIFTFEIAGVEIWITETIVNTWLIMAVLIGLAIFARIKMKDFKVIPTGVQSVIEIVIEMFDNFVTSTVGKNLSYIGPWFFMVFVFLLASCFVSTIGMRAPTADFATTFALALATFTIMVALGFRHRKGKYLKSFFEPNPIFFPLNLVGELSKPISLSFRLFGNMLSGTIILMLYYAIAPFLVQIGIPALLHAFFDIVLGALQAYIFVIISLMYVKGAAESE